ncbi:hypothetical protein RvY_03453 [Ramazzottius varieornatus]|uniref:DDE-1 domain-containing protein n=1 Tax=Ramazzottius varieornatus TaxID=947166 RepID=A0A1D1UYB4_RAMVA|nr:hypothetical protein RvY_03453 [Ramazzottius varieornatus]
MGRPHAVYRLSEALRNLRGQEQSGKSVNAYAKLVTIPESTIRGWRKRSTSSWNAMKKLSRYHGHVTGDGQKFPAAIVVKGGAKTGKLSGRIVNKLGIPDNVIVYSTRTAWWNSRLYLEWIDDLFDGKDPEFLVLHFPGHLKFESAELLEEMKVH